MHLLFLLSQTHQLADASSAPSTKISSLTDELESATSQVADATASLATCTSNYEQCTSKSGAIAESLKLAEKVYDAQLIDNKSTKEELKASYEQIQSLKLEVASLEEQLLEFTNRKTPGPIDHLLAFFTSIAQIVTDMLPGIVEESVTFLNWVSKSVTDFAAPIVPQLEAALSHVVSNGKTLFAKALPLLNSAQKTLMEKSGPALDAAVGKITEARDLVQAKIYEQALGVEQLASVVTSTHALWVANAVVRLPIVLILWRFAKLFFGILFGQRKYDVPKHVADDSVPLRTPTPETKTVPFGASPARTRGRAIRSPNGEVLRFA